MKRAQLILFFLIINMGSLAIGSWLMNNGPKTDWYINLNKAPWSPPGWLFGIAWTTIMVCFSVLLAHLFSKKSPKKLK
jgi:tryptophan-rich sensory protein